MMDSIDVDSIVDKIRANKLWFGHAMERNKSRGCKSNFTNECVEEKKPEKEMVRHDWDWCETVELCLDNKRPN